ncbi:MAG: NAD-dependent epimerase/dehydratase family protein [Pseudomonadota bacterium]
MSSLILGCGYTGTRLAKRDLAGGTPVQAVVSKPERVHELAAQNIEAVAWNLDQRAPAPSLAPFDTLVYLAPPPSSGDTDPRLEHALDALGSQPKRLIYISTTGVYGNRNGTRVTEDDAPSPESARAHRRVAAERTATAWARSHGARCVILRVPGIYGPSRLPLKAIMDARPVLAQAEAGPGNRIHVDDLVTVIQRVREASDPPDILNVGDGNPLSSTDFTFEVARQTGRPPPPEHSLDALRAEVSEMAWSFIRESRLVDVSRLHNTLAPPLRYLDPKAGIAASLQEMDAG